MKYYQLAADEVPLYQCDEIKSVDPEGYCVLILTNRAFVIVKIETHLFKKDEYHVETFPTNTIKVYNGKPQLKADKKDPMNVTIYFTDREIQILFPSKRERNAFTNAVYELLTGKTLFRRGAENVNEAIQNVDTALGIDTINTAAGILSGKFLGSAVGNVASFFTGKKKQKVSEKSAESDKSDASVVVTVTETKTTESTQEMSFDQQIDAVKKLKELLDAGVITQEEFEAKKKKIMEI